MIFTGHIEKLLDAMEHLPIDDTTITNWLTTIGLKVYKGNFDNMSIKTVGDFAAQLNLLLETYIKKSFDIPNEGIIFLFMPLNSLSSSKDIFNC